MTVEREDREDIEEVGDAVEALGIMIEEALKVIYERIGGLHSLVAQMNTGGQGFKEELLELKKEMAKSHEVIRGLENIVSRTESRLVDMQKNISDDEDYSEDIKNDLLIIKRDLQFVRGDLNELLPRKEDMEK